MHENQNERLVYFSDAVIAITITLLVLDIRLPEGLGEMTDAGLWAALAAVVPGVRAYLISFAAIGAFWIGHHQRFAMIPKRGRFLILANLVFLCAISLMPLVTRLIAENGGALATQLYAALLALCAAGLMLIWGLAMQAGLIADNVPIQARWRTLIVSGLAVLVFIVSIPLAAVSPDGAKYFWLLLLPLTLVPRLLPGGRP